MNTNHPTIEALVRLFIKEICAAGSYYLAGDIPEKKLKAATEKYAKEVDTGAILGLTDFSVTGNGKTGIIFTTAGMYLNLSFEKPTYILYDNIKSAAISSTKTKDCDSTLVIYFKDGRSSLTIRDSFINKTPMKGFVEQVIECSNEGLTEDSDKYIILEDMPEATKQQYVAIIIDFMLADDELSGSELSALYKMMARIKLSTDSRRNLLSYITSAVHTDVESKIASMDANLRPSMREALHISLIKDILVLCDGHYSCIPDQQKEFFDSLIQHLGISEDKIAFLEEAISLDAKFLSGELNEQKYVKAMGDLGAKAAAIGVPVAAIYLSGSVAGLSAAGITSGLAAMGLGGVLGLSSMVTGIGIAVLVGVTAYQGIKFVTGKGEKEKQNRREVLIQEAMKLNQDTISALIEDINSLMHDFLELTAENEINREALLRCQKKLRAFVAAYGVVTKKEPGLMAL